MTNLDNWNTVLSDDPGIGLGELEDFDEAGNLLDGSEWGDEDEDDDWFEDDEGLNTLLDWEDDEDDDIPDLFDIHQSDD